MKRLIGILPLAALIVFTAGGIGAGTAGEHTAPAPQAAGKIKLVQVDVTPGGRVVQIERSITLDQYRAMHARKAKAKARAETEAQPQGPAKSKSAPGSPPGGLLHKIAYVGTGGPGCFGPNCKNPNEICQDADLWVYNLSPGWNQAYPDVNNLVIGCFRGRAWDYLPAYWQNNIKSVWGGDFAGAIKDDVANYPVVSWSKQGQVENIKGLSGSDWVVTDSNPLITARSYLDSFTSNCGTNIFRFEAHDGSLLRDVTARGTYTPGNPGKCTYYAGSPYLNPGAYTVYSSYPQCSRKVNVPHASQNMLVGFTPTCADY